MGSARNRHETVSGGGDGSIMAGPDGTMPPRLDGGEHGTGCVEPSKIRSLLLTKPVEWGSFAPARALEFEFLS